jgi:heme-degrading monooxygenase HmoA
MSPSAYLRVWQYVTTPDRVDDFVAAYGSTGTWARLFAQSPGFLGTELFRSEDAPDAFITVDRWQDEQHWTAFLQQRREAYEALDAALAPLTVVDCPLHEGR